PYIPSKSAVKPDNGLLQSSAKITAPIDGKTTYTPSHATLDITPSNTSPNVIKRFGTDKTKPLRMALIIPECSATPIPNIVTKTTPKGAKPTKLSVMFVKI